MRASRSRCNNARKWSGKCAKKRRGVIARKSGGGGGAIYVRETQRANTWISSVTFLFDAPGERCDERALASYSEDKDLKLGSCPGSAWENGRVARTMDHDRSIELLFSRTFAPTAAATASDTRLPRNFTKDTSIRCSIAATRLASVYPYPKSRDLTMQSSIAAGAVRKSQLRSLEDSSRGFARVSATFSEESPRSAKQFPGVSLESQLARGF